MLLTCPLKKTDNLGRVSRLLGALICTPTAALRDQMQHVSDRHEALWKPDVNIVDGHTVFLRTRTFRESTMIIPWYGWQLSLIMSTLGRPAQLRGYGELRAPFISLTGLKIPIVSEEVWQLANLRNITRVGCMPEAFVFSPDWTPSHSVYVQPAMRADLGFRLQQLHADLMQNFK